MTPDALSTRIREVLDRQEIVDAGARFCERVDEYDIDGLTDVFTEDVFTDYGPGRGGPVRGRDAVLHRIANGQAEFRRTQHRLGQTLIQLDGDEASATTYVSACWVLMKLRRQSTTTSTP